MQFQNSKIYVCIKEAKPRKNTPRPSNISVWLIEVWLVQIDLNIFIVYRFFKMNHFLMQFQNSKFYVCIKEKPKRSKMRGSTQWKFSDFNSKSNVSMVLLKNEACFNLLCNPIIRISLCALKIQFAAVTFSTCQPTNKYLKITLTIDCLGF